MNNTDKLEMTKAFLGIEGNDEDGLISSYLEAAGREIISWKYGNNNFAAPETVDDEDELVQVNAVVAGYNLIGMENQVSHSENGISRTFKYPSMVAYIRSNVRAYVRICR